MDVNVNSEHFTRSQNLSDAVRFAAIIRAEAGGSSELATIQERIERVRRIDDSDEPEDWIIVNQEMNAITDDVYVIGGRFRRDGKSHLHKMCELLGACLVDLIEGKYLATTTTLIFDRPVQQSIEDMARSLDVNLRRRGEGSARAEVGSGFAEIHATAGGATVREYVGAFVTRMERDGHRIGISYSD